MMKKSLPSLVLLSLFFVGILHAVTLSDLYTALDSPDGVTPVSCDYVKYRLANDEDGTYFSTAEIASQTEEIKWEVCSTAKYGVSPLIGGSCLRSTLGTGSKDYDAQYISLNLQVTGPGRFSFYYMTSTASANFNDALVVLVDGEEMFSASGYNANGDTDYNWRRAVVALCGNDEGNHHAAINVDGDGAHTITFRFVKDDPGYDYNDNGRAVYVKDGPVAPVYADYDGDRETYNEDLAAYNISKNYFGNCVWIDGVTWEPKPDFAYKLMFGEASADETPYAFGRLEEASDGLDVSLDAPSTPLPPVGKMNSMFFRTISAAGMNLPAEWNDVTSLDEDYRGTNASASTWTLVVDNADAPSLRWEPVSPLNITQASLTLVLPDGREVDMLQESSIAQPVSGTYLIQYRESPDVLPAPATPETLEREMALYPNGSNTFQVLNPEIYEFAGTPAIAFIQDGQIVSTPSGDFLTCDSETGTITFMQSASIEFDEIVITYGFSYRHATRAGSEAVAYGQVRAVVAPVSVEMTTSPALNLKKYAPCDIEYRIVYGEANDFGDNGVPFTASLDLPSWQFSQGVCVSCPWMVDAVLDGNPIALSFSDDNDTPEEGELVTTRVSFEGVAYEAGAITVSFTLTAAEEAITGTAAFSINTLNDDDYPCDPLATTATIQILGDSPAEITWLSVPEEINEVEVEDEWDALYGEAFATTFEVSIEAASPDGDSVVADVEWILPVGWYFEENNIFALDGSLISTITVTTAGYDTLDGEHRPENDVFLIGVIVTTDRGLVTEEYVEITVHDVDRAAICPNADWEDPVVGKPICITSYGAMDPDGDSVSYSMNLYVNDEWIEEDIIGEYDTYYSTYFLQAADAVGFELFALSRPLYGDQVVAGESYSIPDLYWSDGFCDTPWYPVLDFSDLGDAQIPDWDENLPHGEPEGYAIVFTDYNGETTSVFSLGDGLVLPEDYYSSGCSGLWPGKYTVEVYPLFDIRNTWGNFYDVPEGADGCFCGDLLGEFELTIPEYGLPGEGLVDYDGAYLYVNVPMASRYELAIWKDGQPYTTIARTFLPGEEGLCLDCEEFEYGFADAGTYTATIQGFNPLGYGIISEEFPLTTVEEPMEPPMTWPEGMFTPYDEQRIISAQPTCDVLFSWPVVPGAVEYELHIAQIRDHYSPLYYDSLWTRENTCIFSMEAGKRYEWSVTAITADDTWLWSDEKVFRISPLYSAIQDGLGYWIIDGEAMVASVAYQAFDPFSIEIPAEVDGCPVTSIGNGSFEYCDYLKSVVLPETVTSIGEKAFYDCNGLQTIVLNEGLLEIGEEAFCSCRRLATIEIPASVQRIDPYAFAYCQSLEAIQVDDDNEGYASLDGVLYSKELTILLCYPPSKPNTAFTVPDSVAEIAQAAFVQASNLVSITIPDSVTVIGRCAFESCTALESIAIPDGVTTIAYSTFNGCTSLESITIPDSVTTIDSSAFERCTSLKSVTIPDGVKYITRYSFYGCTSLESVTIPDTITYIYDYAFYGCSSLNNISIPDSVKSIYAYAFYGCTSLESITIPNSVTSISAYAFSGCTSLESITIPDSVTIIYQNAFYGCTSLESVTIPDSVTRIYDNAFYGCSTLSSMVFKGEPPQFGNNSYPTPITFYVYPGMGWENVELDGVEIVMQDNTIPWYPVLQCNDLGDAQIPNWDEDNPHGEPEGYAIVFTSADEEATSVFSLGDGPVVPQNYYSSGCCGLLPGDYTVEVYPLFDTWNTWGEFYVITSEADGYFCGDLLDEFELTIPEYGLPGEGLVSYHNGFLYVSVPMASGYELAIWKDGQPYRTITRAFLPDDDAPFFEGFEYGFAEPGTYTATIRGFNPLGYGITSEEFPLTTIEEPMEQTSSWPGPGGGFAPYDGQLIISAGAACDVLFTWPVIPAAVSYELNVSFEFYDDSLGGWSYSTCTSLELEENVCLLPMEAEKWYDWTVTAIAADGTRLVSSQRFFKISPCRRSLYRTMQDELAYWIIDGKAIVGFEDTYRYYLDNIGISAVVDGCPVTAIGNGCFYDCSSLQNIVIPDSVTKIGDSAFSGCTRLEVITIPVSVTTIGAYAFADCNALSKIYFEGEPPQFGNNSYPTPITFYVYPGMGWEDVELDGVEIVMLGDTLPWYPFLKCDGLDDAQIPSWDETIPHDGAEGYAIVFTSADGETTSVFSWDDRVLPWAYYSSGCSGLLPGDYTVEVYPLFSTEDTWWRPYKVPVNDDYFLGELLDEFELTVPEYGLPGEGLVDYEDGYLYVDVPMASRYELTILKDGQPYRTITRTFLPDDNGLCSSFEEFEYGFAEPGTYTATIRGFNPLGNGITSEEFPLTTVEEPMEQDWYWPDEGFTPYEEQRIISTEPVSNVFFSWPVVPAAVGYELNVYCEDEENYDESTTYTSLELEGNACIIPMETEKWYEWTVTAIAANGTILKSYIRDFKISRCRRILYRTVQDGLVYWIIDEEATASGFADQDDYPSSLVIPAEADGRPVTAIEGFGDCEYLESVVLPETVTSITGGAFDSCSGLQTIVLNDGLVEIGIDAFWGCDSLDTIAIPASVQRIGVYAFGSCSRLESIQVDENNEAFATQDGMLYSKDLTKLLCYPAGKPNAAFTVPDFVTEIGIGAFAGALNLASITIPDSVTMIGYEAFYQCTNLIEATLPSGLTTIPSGLFYECHSLESITIPESVTTIEGSAFYGCSSLESITIPDSVTTINSYAFYGCTSLTEATLPFGLTAVPYGLFYECTSLESITIPDSVTTIESSAFSGCTSLESITIPDSVTVIYGDAFYGCTSLESITIPASVTVIYGYAFYGCSALSAMVFEGEPPQFDYNSYPTPITFYVYPDMGWEDMELDGVEIVITEEMLPPPVILREDDEEDREFFSGSATICILFAEGEVPEGLEIRYTLDGSRPTAASPLYEEPFAISHSTIVTAGYFLEDEPTGRITRRSFVTGELLPIEAFENDDAHPWTVVEEFYEGQPAFQSGAISSNQTTSLFATVQGEGTLSFAWMVSSENNFDFLRFFLDGVAVISPISGETDWTLQSIRITGDGEHTVEWRYTKDGSVNKGSDCGWVANVLWDSDSASQVQILELAAGWNWVGFQVLPPDGLKVADVLGTEGFSVNDIIQTDNGRAVFNGRSWIPSDFSIDYGRLYQIRLATPVALAIEGEPSGSNMLQVAAGWNWIALPTLEACTPDQLLHSAGWSVGDRIQSGDGSMVTFSGTKWIPSNGFTLEPGKGYQLKAKNAGVITFE